MDNTDASSKHFPDWKFWKRRRHVVSGLAFFGFFNIYSLRVNLSVAIVAMTSKYNTTIDGNIVEKQDFDWDSKEKGLVLSSFFYGYICTQLLGGWLATKYGGSRIYGIGVATTALLTLLTPIAANTSISCLIVLRIIEGIFEGVTYPCIHAVWANWAPPAERSFMASLAFSGSYFGTVVALPVSGLLAKCFGWPSVFYVTGIVGLIWSSIWWFVVKDDPADDPYISKEELNYLKETLQTNKNEKFLKSFPVWAIVMAHFCENWGFYTLLTQLPTFMKDTLNYDLQKAGFMSSVPYLVMAIIMQFAGRISDWMCNKKILSTTNVRKLFNCVAFVSQTIFMLMAAHKRTPTGVVACLVLAVGLGALAWPAFSVNHLDLAPQHASVLMGLSNTFATLPGIVSPLLTGYIVTNKSAEEWKYVFYISGGIYLIGAVFYGSFASGERQPWANPKKKVSIDNYKHGYTNNGLEMESVAPHGLAIRV